MFFGSFAEVCHGIYLLPKVITWEACSISSLFTVFAARRIMTISLVSDIRPTLKSSRV